MEYAVENTLAKRLHVVLFEESDKRDSFFTGFNFESGMDLFALMAEHRITVTGDRGVAFRGFSNLKVFKKYVEKRSMVYTESIVIAIPSLDGGLVAAELIESTGWLVSFLLMNPNVHLLCGVDFNQAFTALFNALVEQSFPRDTVRVDTYPKDNAPCVPCVIDEDGWVDFDPFLSVSERVYEDRVRLACGLDTRPLGQHEGKMQMSEDFCDSLELVKAAVKES
jgi:hypothetical protein